MNCKYFTVRTKKGNRYKFCRLRKQIIDFSDCKKCKSKEYKNYKKLKKEKHNRTKATEIQDGVKEATITHSDGHISISKTTKVTGKGQVYFINKFLNT